MQDDFYGFIESLSDKDWQTKVDGEWTVKDVIAHLVGWEKECAIQLPIIWQTKQEPWFIKSNDYAEFNKRSVEEYKDYQPRQLLDEWYDWQDKIQQEADAIGEASMKSHPELFSWYFEGTDFDETGVDHLTEHFQQIKKILDK